jgi:hypothetical protein
MPRSLAADWGTLNADNLAANYSRELADFIIYVIDVAAGDKIPRKGGPGITQADLLVGLWPRVSHARCVLRAAVSTNRMVSRERTI